MSRKKSWLYTTNGIGRIELKQFIRNYGLSIFITLFFSGFIIQATLLHTANSTPISSMLSGFTSIGSDYNPVDNAAATQTVIPETTSAPSTASTAAIPPQQSPAATADQPAVVTPAAFAVTVQDVRQAGASMRCKGNKKDPRNCSVQYTFKATLSPENTTGTISYEWFSNVFTDVHTEQLSLDRTKTVTKTITVSCQAASDFTVQLIMSDPVTESLPIPVHQDC